MNIIEKNLANIVYKKSYMIVTTYLLKQITIHRELDKSWRVEYEDGSCEYFSDPNNLGLEDDDIRQVTMSFPTLKEDIIIYV